MCTRVFVFPCVLWLNGTSDRCDRKSLFIFPQAVKESVSVCVCVCTVWVKCRRSITIAFMFLLDELPPAALCHYVVYGCVPVCLSTCHTHHCYTVIVDRMSSILYFSANQKWLLRSFTGFLYLLCHPLKSSETLPWACYSTVTLWLYNHPCRTTDTLRWIHLYQL